MTTTNIVWNWGTNTNINFNAATDILDFGWFAADQFNISQVSETVVIAIPSNHQTYTLQHTTLSDLHLSNIVAKDAFRNRRVGDRAEHAGYAGARAAAASRGSAG